MNQTNQKKHRKISKKLSVLAVFTIFVAVAMSFVSWLIYAVFAENYRDIKQQYYAVVSKQIVEDVENSVKNGKQIDRFYGMDAVLSDMLDLISTDTVKVGAAVLDPAGSILYSSVSTDPAKDSYYSMLNAGSVRSNAVFASGDTAYRITSSASYEVMLLPIFDQSGTQLGTLALFYHSADIENELIAQKESSNRTTAICIAATILVLIVYILCLPKSITEDKEQKDGHEVIDVYHHKQKQNAFLFLIPVLLIMVGLLVQCVLSYNEYQKRYRDVMFESADGISSYVGAMISDLHEKGVPYERMLGLDSYLAEKVADSPLLWSVSLVRVYADTSDILERSSEYTLSQPVDASDEENSMFINVEVSKAYIDEKMTDMLLVFAASFVVALIMIYELLKLPDSLFVRVSRQYRESREIQSASIAPAVRLAMFIAFTGMYVGIPFSSVLITQWNQSLFGLPVSFIASIPMTAELLATMLCSLFLLPLFRILPLRGLFTVSAGLTAIANILCFMASSPLELILFRFMAGIGLAGYKYSMNTIVGQGSISDKHTTDNLAEMNAGLLGGITCGGTLGAIIAGAIGIQTAYLISAIFLGLFIVIVLSLMPWKLVRTSFINLDMTEDAKPIKQKSTLSCLADGSLWRYLLLVAVPMNFGLMFVVAFFPGFVSALGLPGVTTSYGYLVNGLVGIYIGPKLLRLLSERIGRTACVFATLVLGAVSVLILNINFPLVIVLTSVALLGLFDGFGTPASSDYYVNLPVIREIGVSKGLSLLSVVGSCVQTASPVIYSVILSAGLLGTNILGAAFIGCALLFILTARMSGKKQSPAAAEPAEAEAKQEAKV